MISLSRFTACAPRRIARNALAAAAFVVLTGGTPPRQTGVTPYEYTSPLPGSRLVSPQNNIVIREGHALDPASISPDRISVVGNGSGAHHGRLSLSDDGRTLVFLPDAPFSLGEAVQVTLRPGITTIDGAPLSPYNFGFEVSNVSAGDEAIGRAGIDAAMPWAGDGLATPEPSGAAPSGIEAAPSCDGLPARYPGISILTSDHPDPGQVFIAPWGTGRPGSLLILDGLGMPLYHRSLFRFIADFKRQPNGLLTYFDREPPGGGERKFFAMDSTYAVVDSFEAGNGYRTDMHELQILPDGHALLMSYDAQPVRMDLVVDHGDPDAFVTGLVVQELDRARNVVFQWRSWDHYEITDTSPWISLSNPAIDYVHGNSIDLDHDGNLLISSRACDEITKIDRRTGNIIWRLGPHARQNEFAFLDDPRGFSHQHDVRRLPNGHITLFDNGNFIQPEFSRAIEYEVDEANRTARLVWEYRGAPDVFGIFAGNLQRLPGGNTVIGWGGSLTDPKVTEVRPDGSKALEIKYTPNDLWSYRAFKFPWRSALLVTGTESVDFGGVAAGGTATRSLRVRNGSARDLTIGCAVSTNPAFSVTTPLPLSLSPGQETTLELAFAPGSSEAQHGKLYLRMPERDQFVAQDLVVSGNVNAAPDVSNAHAVEPELWPANHALAPVAIAGVTDPDGDPVTLMVTGVTQDEPVLGAGAGATCPDAMIESGQVSVRAERAGGGNGRVYRIAFTADDGRGGVSEGAVTVCVPHDRGGKGACVDDGQAWDALGTCHGAADAVAPEPAASAAPGTPTLALRSLGAAAGHARVAYTLERASEVRLSLFDLSGRRVTAIDAGRREAGEHRLEWSTSGLSPGIYFYRLMVEGRSLSQAVPILG